jgi:hypothetical protein
MLLKRGAFRVRKLIAVLEHDPVRAEEMSSWLRDRLYMYEQEFTSDLPTLIGVIKPRLIDVLVLCLNRESLGGPGSGAERAWGAISECVQSGLERFPILVHSVSGPAPDEASLRLAQKGWQIKILGPIEGQNWIGDEWYPALKRTLRNLAEYRSPTDGNHLDLGRIGG